MKQYAEVNKLIKKSGLKYYPLKFYLNHIFD